MNNSLFNTGYVDPLTSFSNWGVPTNPTVPYGPGMLDGGIRDMRFPGGGMGNISAPNAGGGGSWLDPIGGLDGARVGLGALSGLANAFMSMKQYGLAKDTFNENKRQFELNYGAQRDTTNTQLRDRQAARVASNAGAYQSVDDYMAQNRIK